MPRKEQLPPQPKYWQYDAGDGWTIFAGKTDEDNDQLSLHFRKQTDWWFHVKSQPGSHVLLRAPEGVDANNPPKEKLERAAAVAAWHSKARNGGITPVDCTRANCVSKPRGAKPGLVEISKATVIKVRPGIPGEKP